MGTTSAAISCSASELADAMTHWRVQAEKSPERFQPDPTPEGDRRGADFLCATIHAIQEGRPLPIIY